MAAAGAPVVMTRDRRTAAMVARVVVLASTRREAVQVRRPRVTVGTVAPARTALRTGTEAVAAAALRATVATPRVRPRPTETRGDGGAGRSTTIETGSPVFYGGGGAGGHRFTGNAGQGGAGGGANATSANPAIGNNGTANTGGGGSGATGTGVGGAGGSGKGVIRYVYEGPIYEEAVSISLGAGDNILVTDAVGPAVVGARTGWHNVTGGNPTRTNLASDVGATTVGIDITNGFGDGANTRSTGSGPTFNLFENGIRVVSGGNATRCTISTVPWPFDVLVFYDEATQSSLGVQVSITDQTTTFQSTIDEIGQFAGAFALNENQVAGQGQLGNFVHFKGFTGGSAIIEIDESNSSHSTLWSGLMIVRRGDLE